jgi:hypothetical protein
MYVEGCASGIFYPSLFERSFPPFFIVTDGEYHILRSSIRAINRAVLSSQTEFFSSRNDL